MTEVLPLNIIQFNSCCSGRVRWNKMAGDVSMGILNISAAGASLAHTTVWKKNKSSSDLIAWCFFYLVSGAQPQEKRG